MTPSVVPSASSVAISGSPAATSEPKVINRTIAAAMIPKNSDGPWLLVKRTTSAPGPAVLDLQLRAARGERGVLDLLERLGLDVVGALRRRSSVATPMRPSFVSWPPGENGLWTPATDGAAATFFSAASMRALIAGSFSVPLRALKTSWSVSPLAAGKCSASRS